MARQQKGTKQMANYVLSIQVYIRWNSIRRMASRGGNFPHKRKTVLRAAGWSRFPTHTSCNVLQHCMVIYIYIYINHAKPKQIHIYIYIYIYPLGFRGGYTATTKNEYIFIKITIKTPYIYSTPYYNYYNYNGDDFFYKAKQIQI